jgi:hypothetical protein
MEAAAAVAASVAPLWQAETQHVEAVRLQNELHRQAIEQARQLHKESMELNDALFREECKLDKELHLRQVVHDYDIARREGIRDTWSQRNQLVQTLMIVDTVVFSGGYSMLIQESPASDAPMVLVELYVGLLGAGLSLLFASLWFSLKLQTRLAQFDIYHQDTVYVCGKRHRQFADYYECHGAQLTRLAFYSFYIGTVSVMASAAVITFIQLVYEWDAASGAWVVIIVVGVAITFLFLGNLHSCLRRPRKDIVKGIDGSGEVEEMAEADEYRGFGATETTPSERSQVSSKSMKVS